MREAAEGGGSPLAYAELLVNDLEEAALSLRPEIGEALEALRGGWGGGGVRDGIGADRGGPVRGHRGVPTGRTGSWARSGRMRSSRRSAP